VRNALSTSGLRQKRHHPQKSACRPPPHPV